MIDHWLGESSVLAGIGIEDNRWLAPVRPGDRLTALTTTVGKSDARNRRDAGIVAFATSLRDQSGREVMTQTASMLFGRRAPRQEASPAAHVGAGAGAKAAAPAPPPPERIDDLARAMPDDFARARVGAFAELGETLFYRRTHSRLRAEIRSGAISYRRGGGARPCAGRDVGRGAPHRGVLDEPFRRGARAPRHIAQPRLAGLSRHALAPAGAGRRPDRLFDPGRRQARDLESGLGLITSRNLGSTSAARSRSSFTPRSSRLFRRPAEIVGAAGLGRGGFRRWRPAGRRRRQARRPARRWRRVTSTFPAIGGGAIAAPPPARARRAPSRERPELSRVSQAERGVPAASARLR